jgi:flavin reductase
VCINRRSPMCSAILENGVFCINLLSTQQKEISDTFSGRPHQGPPYDFGCGQWTVGETGSPVLQGAVSDFDCRMERRYDAGSHTIFLGAVVDVLATESSPLLYSRRDYGYLTRLNAHNH